MRTICIAILAASSLSAQVSYQRLLDAEREPGNWMTYSGSYRSQRHSKLEQINSDNVARLQLKWAFQMKTLETVETTPLVVDGIMYLTRPPNDVFALDAGNGRPYWNYRRSLPERINVCCAARRKIQSGQRHDNHQHRHASDD